MTSLGAEEIQRSGSSDAEIHRMGINCINSELRSRARFKAFTCPATNSTRDAVYLNNTLQMCQDEESRSKDMDFGEGTDRQIGDLITTYASIESLWEYISKVKDLRDKVKKELIWHGRIEGVSLMNGPPAVEETRDTSRIDFSGCTDFRNQGISWSLPGATRSLLSAESTNRSYKTSKVRIKVEKQSSRIESESVRTVYYPTRSYVSMLKQSKRSEKSGSAKQDSSFSRKAIREKETRIPRPPPAELDKLGPPAGFSLPRPTDKARDASSILHGLVRADQDSSRFEGHDSFSSRLSECKEDSLIESIAAIDSELESHRRILPRGNPVTLPNIRLKKSARRSGKLVLRFRCSAKEASRRSSARLGLTNTYKDNKLRRIRLP